MNQKHILFVCLGNICRSPMAETIFNSLLEKNNLKNRYHIDSAGLDNYHQGEPADKRMREHASDKGYHITHRSRPITTDDFDKFDLIIGMDQQNIRALEQRAKNDAQRSKIKRITNYCQKYITADAVPDPYYGGEQGFKYVIELLEDACNGLLLEEES